MSSTDLVWRLIALFDELSIPYMLVGSYSSNYYGRPRSTQDADFVVTLTGDRLTLIRQALAAEFSIDPQMTFETVTMTMRHVIVHRETAFKVELFVPTDDPHDQARFARRQRVDFDQVKASLPTAEEVIIQKLRWGT